MKSFEFFGAFWTTFIFVFALTFWPIDMGGRSVSLHRAVIEYLVAVAMSEHTVAYDICCRRDMDWEGKY